VVDSSEAPIPGALVTATSPGASDPTSATTDLRGAFTLTLKAGQYSVRVHVDGFRDVEERVAAGPADAPPARFVLQVAGVREAVTVTAPAGYRSRPSLPRPDAHPASRRPQSVTVVTSELIKDQMMVSVGDVMRYVPGVMVHQGENNRDQVIIRGNSSSADFFVDGVRDDVQYYRDLYNLERVETLKGPNAMIFGRGGAGGVVNRVSREAGFSASREVSLQGGMFGHKRLTAGFNQPVNSKVAFRLDGMFENSDSFRNAVGLERYGVTPTATISAGPNTKVTLRYEFLKDTRTADRGITSFQGRPANVDADTFYGNPDLSDVHGQRQHGLRPGRAPRRPRHDPQPHRRRELRSLLSEFRARRGQRQPVARGADVLQQRHQSHQRLQPDRRASRSSRPAGCVIRCSPAPSSAVSSPTTSEHRLLQQHGDVDSRAVHEPDDLDAGHVPAECHRRRQPSDDERGGRVRPGSDRTVDAPAGRRRPAIRSVRPHLSQQPHRRDAGPPRRPRVAAGWCRLQADGPAVDLQQLQRVLPASSGDQFPR
jgi:hypothetical protein